MNVAPFETRVALLKNQSVSEVHIERKNDTNWVGNIYLGKVQRILPGMQAAFIELGLEKAGFLYIDDLVDTRLYLENNELEQPKSEKTKIELLLKQGQEILVQVTKAPIGTKGPRLTCEVALPGRFLVFTPHTTDLGISRQIQSSLERNRLQSILENLNNPVKGGFIARTVCEGASEEWLQKDAQFLLSLWQAIQEKVAQSKAPCLIQPELDLVLKSIRDLTNEDLNQILIDDPETFKRAKHFFERFDLSISKKLELYGFAEPIFERYGIESELTKATSKKAWLKSGGYLIFDQTEALTVIDVNSGRFVGRTNLQDTILSINLEACMEIANQLKLRNIGGMIIIDFIDMEHVSDRDRILQVLQEALKSDRAKCDVKHMSELGLVQMTRKRTSESLQHILCEPCSYCSGQGTVKSKKTVLYEILRELMRKAGKIHEIGLVVYAHPDIIELLQKEEQNNLQVLQKQINKQIWFYPVATLYHEQFDIVPAKAKPS